MKRCAVTGTTGYVGSVIASHLRSLGHDVLELTRGSASSALHQAHFDLTLPIDAGTLRGVDVLVHCAYDFRPRSAKAIHETNVAGSERLFRAADAAGVARIVLISTLSAHPGCRSLYGQAKLAIEAATLSRGGVVIRPGLVFGERSAGMVGALERVAARLPVVPLIGGGNQLLYPCLDADLAHLVAEVVRTEGPLTSPLVAASESAVTLRRIVESLSASRGRKPRFVTVPSVVAHLGLLVLESIGVRPRFSSDGIVTLTRPGPAPDFTATRKLGISFRPFPA